MIHSFELPGCRMNCLVNRMVPKSCLLPFLWLKVYANYICHFLLHKTADIIEHSLYYFADMYVRFISRLCHLVSYIQKHSTLAVLLLRGKRLHRSSRKRLRHKWSSNRCEFQHIGHPIKSRVWADRSLESIVVCAYYLHGLFLHALDLDKQLQWWLCFGRKACWKQTTSKKKQKIYICGTGRNDRRHEGASNYYYYWGLSLFFLFELVVDLTWLWQRWIQK